MCEQRVFETLIGGATEWTDNSVLVDHEDVSPFCLAFGTSTPDDWIAAAKKLIDDELGTPAQPG